MFKKRSTQLEIIDNLSFSDPLLINNLKEMEKINHWLGYNHTLIKAIKKIYKQNQWVWHKQKQKIKLADLGCGSADCLRYIHQWLIRNNLSCDLVGIDANEFVLKYAQEICSDFPQIHFEREDVLAENDASYDLVMLNHLCHHLTDEKIVTLLETLLNKTRLAIIINDLHRHPLAYFGIKLIAKLFHFSKLTKHDGPLSVLRGFHKKELIFLLEKTSAKKFEIRWCWPFRWQIIIWNQETFAGAKMHG